LGGSVLDFIGGGGGEQMKYEKTNLHLEVKCGFHRTYFHEDKVYNSIMWGIFYVESHPYL